MADRMILGENVAYSTDCEKTGLNNNVIVCAGSGGGKTMSVMEPRLLETFGSSLIVTVTKRRLVNKYKKLFRERGYVVQDLNFVSPAESDIAYDPLAYMKSYMDITYLARALIEAGSEKPLLKGDPYWDEAAVSLLSAEIGLVMEMDPKACFTKVLAVHDCMEIRETNEGMATTLDRSFNRLEEMKPDSFALSCWKSFRQVPPKTARCIYGALNTTLDTIFTPELRKMMDLETKVDFRQMSRERTVLFVSSSAVNPSLNRFINVFYSQAFKQLFEYAEKQPDGKLPRPVHILCDDFAVGGRIPNFPEYISIFREKQISVTLLLQSESQLISMYGAEEATTIINNCDTYIYLGGMDLQTARSVSLRLNVPLDEVLYMPVGQEVVFRRGQRPIVTTRYNILENKLYQEIGRQNEGEERSSLYD